jgi:phosphoenolpyruvate-protein phosphotransferase/dihydroxyacetone kinase phosphotransfer subunit
VVGIVIVSHSATLARGVVELARQMGGDRVAIEAAGGMADPEGAIGTDVELVGAAIERAAGPDGVLVLMDLGSAVMSAEMAVELRSGDGVRVVLSGAPLVEGAVAAAARAGAGAGLDEVDAEARAALRMKAADLGGDEEPAAAPTQGGPAFEATHERRLPVAIPLGLHARPAARFVETAGRFDVSVSVTDETTGRGPADGRSLTAMVTLGARQGHSLLVRAGGPQAAEALAALAALAQEGYGDEPGAVAPPRDAAGLAEEAPHARAPDAGERLRGVPVAGGIAIGPARRPAAGGRAQVPEAGTPVGTVAEERARLDGALEAARGDIAAARERIAQRAGEAEAAIFDAHLLLLEDSVLLEPARQAIEAGEGAARGWSAAAGSAAATFRALDDAYLRERAADVDDVGDQVLRHLTGEKRDGRLITERGILVVDDLSPADAAGLDRDTVDGLAVAHGGATSHAAILARALGIPSVVGLGADLQLIGDGTVLVLDGDAGTLEIAPRAEDLAERERERDAAAEQRRQARVRAAEPARTADGHAVEVAANVGAAAEVPVAVELGAEGVGLLRTEFLFQDRDEAPTEAEQRAVYEEIAAALDGRPLIIRTLDAGADKPLRFLPQDPEDNPFLGVRGIRLALARPELLRDQLRAIVALSGRYPVRVMFPMVTTLDEFRAARAMLEDAWTAAGLPPVPAGVMVEVPAVALEADRFAAEVDFFSVGTNDLSQYTLAAERGNEAVAGLLAGGAAPVLRLIEMVAAAAARHGRWVGVCGELAGDPEAAVVLTGLGVDELSMSATRIPAVKDALRAVTLSDAQAAARRALSGA